MNRDHPDPVGEGRPVTGRPSRAHSRRERQLIELRRVLAVIELERYRALRAEHLAEFPEDETAVPDHPRPGRLER